MYKEHLKEGLESNEKRRNLDQRQCLVMECACPPAVKLSILLGSKFNICMLCRRNGENFQNNINFNVQEQNFSKEMVNCRDFAIWVAVVSFGKC